MNSQEFDDIIKSKAQQREADVPEDIWENISLRKKKRRIPFFWLAFLSLLLTGIGVVWNMNHKAGNATIPLTAKNNIEKNNIERKSAAGKTSNKDQVKNSRGEDTTTPAIAIGEHKKSVSTVTAPIDTRKKIAPTGGPSESKVTNADVFAEDLVKNIPASNRSALQITKKKRSKPVNDAGNIDNSKITVSAHQPITNNGRFKAKSFSGETDSMLTAITKDEPAAGSVLITENLLQVNTDRSSQINDRDPLKVKTALMPLSDSIKQPEKPFTAAVTKTASYKNKKAGLKIEFAVTKVFPMQQYEQPLYVKRIIEHPGMRSEFISDNTRTTVESGTGFSVSIIKAINKKWRLGAGIQYLRFTELLHFSGIETNTNMTVVDKTGTIITGRNAYDNFAVPLFVRYSFITQRKWAAGFSAGIYLDMLRSYHNDIPGEFENVYATGTASSGSKNNIGADVFAGVHFTGALWKNYEWFAEPAFRYNLSRYNLNAISFNKKIHKPGISFGVAYRFGKQE